jgi:hypothetical protein
MSLLDSSPNLEDVIVFPEEVITDIDGNQRTRASSTGIPAKARLQEFYQSGTSSRRVESDNEGFNSEQLYRLRFDRKSERALGQLGAQSQLEWRGKKWSFFGDGWPYNGSRRTRRTEYWIVRS